MRMQALMELLRMLLTVLLHLPLGTGLEWVCWAGVAVVWRWGSLRFWELFACCKSKSLRLNIESGCWHSTGTGIVLMQ
jgi:hypothetical protein